MTTDTQPMDEKAGEAVSHNPVVLTLAWMAVGVPLLWGVVETLRKALALFS
jgi:hypothetical protein